VGSQAFRKPIVFDSVAMYAVVNVGVPAGEHPLGHPANVGRKLPHPSGVNQMRVHNMGLEVGK
jgi:hypothetical protein